MDIFLRKATKDDAILVAEISHSTFYETFAADNTREDMEKFLHEQFTRGKLMLEVGAPGNEFFLAYVDDHIAGYVKLRDGTKPKLLGKEAAMEIARLYVVSSYIGYGVGKMLMQCSIDYAREKEKSVVWLGVWEKNQRAIDFYTQWGFEKFDETDFLLGDDLQRDWLMRKVL